MHSRVTSVEIDTMRMSVEGAIRRYEEEIVPKLREQDGFEGMIALVTSEGKGLVITLWETEEAATSEPAQGFYSEAISKFMTSFKDQPGREHYEVALAEIPSLSIRRG